MVQRIVNYYVIYSSYQQKFNLKVGPAHFHERFIWHHAIFRF